MPRPQVFGNRRLLVAVDDRHRIRDLFWPHVGLPNHILGKAVAWGVFADGRMHWVDGPEWTIELGYEDEALIGRNTLLNTRLGIRIETEEACLPGLPAFIRRAVVANLRPQARTIKVYWNHELWLHESHVGNTAMYYPPTCSLIHYKRDVFASFGCLLNGLPPEEWSTGVRTQPGEGSWLQAERGQLDHKSREVGMVDSTFGGPLELPSLGEARADWWVAMADNLEGARRIVASLAEMGIEGALALARGETRGALPAESSLLPKDVVQLARRSVDIIRTQINHNGAILAANDSDAMGPNTLNYSNVWHRDGALVAEALLDAGATDLVEDWLRFCLLTLPPEGLYAQKYWADGSLGVGWNAFWKDGRPVKPIQLDESALTLWNASRAVAEGACPSIADEVRANLIRPLAAAVAAETGPEGLPAPSWDLWEERRGVSFFSVCASIVGLERAAQALPSEGAQWKSVAGRMRSAALELMVGPDGSFVRQLDEAGRQDGVVDAALCAGLALGAFDGEEDVARATLDKVRRVLLDACPIGGCARYEADYYHRQSDDYPGTPWIICTLFVAQAHLQLGDPLGEPMRLLRWCMERAASTGVLAEQAHPETGAPLSVSPLTWSHAEFLRTSLMVARRISD